LLADVTVSTVACIYFRHWCQTCSPEVTGSTPDIAACLRNDSGQALDTRAAVTKQYDLVLVNGR